MQSSNTRDQAGRKSIVGAIAMAVLGLLAIGLAWLGGGTAVASPLTGSCAAGSHGVAVHFEWPSLPAEPAISGVALSGFDPGSCDGQPVELTLSGNPAGNPATDPTELLSTLDSAKDPCTGSALGHPRTIANGSITLTGCSSTQDPGKGAYASVHDITRIRVQVDGHDVLAPGAPGGSQVSAPQGGTHSGGQGGNGSSSAGPAGAGTTVTGVLPNTGGPFGFVLLLGIVLLVFGVVLMFTNRRSRT